MRLYYTRAGEGVYFRPCCGVSPGRGAPPSPILLPHRGSFSHRTHLRPLQTAGAASPARCCIYLVCTASCCLVSPLERCHKQAHAWHVTAGDVTRGCFSLLLSGHPRLRPWGLCVVLCILVCEPNPTHCAVGLSRCRRQVCVQRVHLARREAIGACWVASIDDSALLSDTMHARFFWVTSREWEHEAVVGFMGGSGGWSGGSGGWSGRLEGTLGTFWWVCPCRYVCCLCQGAWAASLDVTFATKEGHRWAAECCWGGCVGCRSITV